MAGQTNLLRHHKQLFSGAITFGYNPKRPISLVVEYEPEAERAQLELARIGFDQIADFPLLRTCRRCPVRRDTPLRARRRYREGPVAVGHAANRGPVLLSRRSARIAQPSCSRTQFSRRLKIHARVYLGSALPGLADFPISLFGGYSFRTLRAPQTLRLMSVGSLTQAAGYLLRTLKVL